MYGDTLRINLSNYFNDSDGDLLSYNYYNSNKYSVNISDRIAEITPNTTGVIYTYFIANDFASISLSNIFVIDVTTMNISQDVGSIIQLNAEINKPVSWIKKVEGNETKIDIPNDAFNISVEKILDNKKAIVDAEKISIVENDTIRPLGDYEIERKIDRLKKRIEEEKSKDAKSSKVKELESELNEVSPKISLSNDSKNKEEKKQKINESIINKTITEVLINDTADEFNVIYSTEPPIVYEAQMDIYTKVITISSVLPYTNVLAYTTINDYPQDSIRIYWLRNDTRELFSNVSYYDINNNTLIDKIEWIVPHLSNQTFEVEITILNVQSYPTVGGNWTVRFNTTGTGNLTINPSNGTSYAEIPDNASTISDLEYLETRCNDVIFNTTIVCSNDVKMPYEVYRINSRIAEIKKRLVELNHTG